MVKSGKQLGDDMKKKSNSKAKVALVLTLIALVALVAIAALMQDGNGSQTRVIDESSPSTIPAQTEAEKQAQQEAIAKKQVLIDSATFVSERELALVVKDPSSNKGKIFKIWGTISQFDSATGTDAFRAQVSSQHQSYWYSDGESVVMTGDSSKLKDFVEDDVFLATVEVANPITYDNVMGGGITAPVFIIHKIEHK